MTQHKAKFRIVKSGNKILLKQVSDDVAQLAETHVIERDITCKFCGSTDTQKYGSPKDVQEYLCNGCGRKFIDKDALFKKQTSIELIGQSLSDYYDGLSFADIARHLTESGNPINESTVYRWIFSYTNKALNYFDTLHPKVSDTWLCDETVLKIAGHIQVKGITHEINNNLIERFHSTIKERTKVMRGFKSLDTAELIMDGFLIHYNYFRPHMSLANATPAEVAKIKIPFKTWTDFVRSDK